jgi:preprotein translocase subunit SecA
MTNKAYALSEKDVEYVIMDNKIMIVDEQTVVSWMVVVILTDYTKRLKPKKM